MTRLQIRYFLAVVEYQGFSRASQAIFVSQPTITQHISALEKELGFKLFNRSYHSLALTEQGKVMYDAFRKIRRIYTDSYAKASGIISGKEGAVSVGLLVMSDLRKVTQSIQRSSKAIPGCSVFLSHSRPEKLGRLLMDGELDMAIIFDDLLSAFPQLSYKKLFPCKYHVILAAGDPLASDAGFACPDSLKGKPFYVAADSALMGGAAEEEEKLFSRLGLSDYSPRVIVQDLETAYAMVADGNGFAIGSEYNCSLGPERFCAKDTNVAHSMCVAWNPAHMTRLASSVLKGAFDVDAAAEQETDPMSEIE